MKVAHLAVVIFFAHAAYAGWLDDAWSSFSDKVSEGAGYLKEKAGPAISETFNSVKNTLQDPETYKKARKWTEDTALPAIRKPFDAAGEYVEKEVAPEVKKVISAMKEGGANANANAN